MIFERLVQSPQSRRLVLALVVVVAGGLLVRRIGNFSVVEGTSMWPTFHPNDVVYARTLDAGVHRGDIVIVADDQGDEVIKRVVALPGETVTLYRGFVYINQQRLSEPYLPKHTYTFKRNQHDEQAIAWHLPAQTYFVLGDNRLQSADSRHYGPVPRFKMHRVVAAPDNVVRPALSEIRLLPTGQVVRDQATPAGGDAKP